MARPGIIFILPEDFPLPTVPLRQFATAMQDAFAIDQAAALQL